MSFTERRVIRIQHRGNAANKLLQYMGSRILARRVSGCEVVGVDIPEFDISIPDDTGGETFFDEIDLWKWDPFVPSFDDLTRKLERSGSVRLNMGDHLQRMEFLGQPQDHRAIFGSAPAETALASDDEIVINIRGAEILDGIAHYPLLPVQFYEDVVESTGLKPLFMGQLTNSVYMDALRQRFRGAKFLESQGARRDFDIMRSAKHIVPSVSTFSWLAAWLSEAETIILPLNGFYNPAHYREIDLLPTDDLRFKYYLFPLNFGLPVKEAMRQHERMSGRWKRVSHNQVNLLRTAAPFLRPPRETYDNGFPIRTAQGARIAFDSVWYAHEYIDAAMEISEGWFEDPLHHYLEVGRLRGYRPVRPCGGEAAFDYSSVNLALGKRATQSSLSQWSRGRSIEEDAGTAVNGAPWEEDGFHTREEDRPWWMVDLGAPAKVHALRIFNRDRQVESIQKRASPLVVEASVDGVQWRQLFQTELGHLFGGYSDGEPLLWTSEEPIDVRWVRISVLGRGPLHLSEVEVFGRQPT